MNTDPFELVYDTQEHLGINVDCSPCGSKMLLCEIGEDSKEDSFFIINHIRDLWSELWPKTHSTVTTLLRESEIPDTTATDDFKLFICKSGGWVDDDFFIEIRFDSDIGWWAVFFKDNNVIHAQSCN